MNLPRFFLTVSVFAALGEVGFAQVIPGPNVSIVSSDPYSQKQLEVDASANPLNPNHIFAGYIDYQTVIDEQSSRVTSKGRCGFSFSTNGGKTWINNLLPSLPNADKCGDPAVAWDTNGHAFYFALTELVNGTTVMTTWRLTDPDDGTGRLILDRQVQIDTGSSGTQLDKNSLIYQPDATPNGGSNAPGTLYACYSSLQGTAQNNIKLLCAISRDGGLTYSKPNQGKYNGNVNSNNGTAGAAGPGGSIYLFWRAFSTKENGHYFVKVSPNGSATSPVQVVGGSQFHPYDPPTGSELARSNAFPAVASDGNQKILLAFQAYSNPLGSMAPASVINTPRIFVTFSTDGGARWSTPKALDYGPHGNTHQFMPRAAYSGGVWSVTFYDGRHQGCIDQEGTIGTIGTSECGVGRVLTSFKTTQGVEYYSWGRDRRFDLRVWQGDPLNPSFRPSANGSVQVTRYETSAKAPRIAGQPRPIVQRDPACAPNCPALNYPFLPVGAGGTVAWMGDYIGHTAKVQFLRNTDGSGPAWRYTRTGDPVTTLAFWADFRDVAFPAGGIGGDWTKFVPAVPASSFLPPGSACLNPKSRDVEVMFAEITNGLSASVKSTAQRPGVPPEFSVHVQNLSGRDLFVRLEIVDKASEDWSMAQTLPAPALIPGDDNLLNVKITKGSSVTKTVYYRWRPNAAAPVAPVVVRVFETTGLNALTGVSNDPANPPKFVGFVPGGNPGVSSGTLPGVPVPLAGLNTSVTYVPSSTASAVGPTHAVTVERVPAPFVTSFKFKGQPSNQLIENHLIENHLIENHLIENHLIENHLIENHLIENHLIENDPIADPLVEDQQVVWTVTGKGAVTTASTAFSNVVNGQQLLESGWKFQVLVYQTQNNPKVISCTQIPIPTDVVLSNIAITQANHLIENHLIENHLIENHLIENHLIENQQIKNFQVSNHLIENHLIENHLIENSLISDQVTNATFAVDSEEKVHVVLRAFKPPSSADTLQLEDPAKSGEAVFGQANDPVTGGSVGAFFDTTPPEITPSVVPAPNLAGWNNTVPVSVSFAVSEAQSPITSQILTVNDGQSPETSLVGCEPYAVPFETLGTILKCSVVNGATTPVPNLSSSAQVTVKVDRTSPNAPTTTINPLPNGNGWNNADVTVTFAAAGDAGNVQSGVVSCTAPITVTGETTGTLVTGSCTDAAGNISATVSHTIRIDRTPPNPPVTSVIPAPNQAGWHKAGPVTVTFTSTGDAGTVRSEGVICVGGGIFNDETAGTNVPGVCTDAAGNTSTSSVTIRIDKTAPNPPLATVTPAPNAAGWNNTNTTPVTVSFASNGDPGNVPSGVQSGACTGPSTFSSETNATLVSGTCTDVAGNVSAATTVTVKIDTTPPSITFVPSSSVGANGSVFFYYSATDGGSGLGVSAPNAVYVSTNVSHRIVRVQNATAGGTTDLYAGGFGLNPRGLTVGPDGKLYAALSDNRIIRLDQNGQDVQVVYSRDSDLSKPASPEVIAFNGGDLYFSTRDTSPTLATDALAGVWKIAGGAPGAAPTQVISLPGAVGQGLAFTANGDLLLVDRAGHRVVRHAANDPANVVNEFIPSSNLQPCTLTVTPVPGITQPACLSGLGVSAGGDVLVSHAGPQQIMRFGASGAPLAPLVTFPADMPRLFAVDAVGDLYVVTSPSINGSGGKVWRVTSNGSATQVGPALDFAIGIAVPPGGGSSGTVAVTSTGTGSVTVTDAAGNQTTATTPQVTIDLTSFVVTNTNDSGSGSLRQAIVNANAHPNGATPDVITFQIPGAGPLFTIAPLSDLPPITDPVVVDGPSQGGPRLIELNGQFAGSSSGLTLAWKDSVVRGLVINRFGVVGIRILPGPAGFSGANSIVGNYIGTNVAGTAALPNAGGGVSVSGSPGNTIGGTSVADRNVISGNSFNGVSVSGAAATGNTILGNFIGTNAGGTAALPNGSFGVNVTGANNTIGGITGVTAGGPCTGACNVIAGNGSGGIALFTSTTGVVVLNAASDTVVQGNYVGVGANGTTGIPNGLSGGLSVGAPRAQIGGTTPQARNVIAANLGDGINLFFATDGGGKDAVIRGNYIGVDATGLNPLGNTSRGIGLNVPNVTIGGTAGVTAGGPCTGACNVIADNRNGGVSVSTAFSNPTPPALPTVLSSGAGTRVQGNFIGVDATGLKPLGNTSNGVSVSAAGAVVGGVEGPAGVVIGGIEPGAGNVISATKPTTNCGGGVSPCGGAGVNLFPSSFGTTIAINGGNIVQGNYIGTNATGLLTVEGTSVFGNAGTGISVSTPNHLIGGADADDGQVDTFVRARNIIAGNLRGGVSISTSFSSATPPALPTVVTSGAGTRVQGNSIGVDVTGTKALGNINNGLNVSAAGVYIGGTAPGAGNVIAASRIDTTPNCGGTGITNCGGTGLNMFVPSSSGVFADGSGNIVQGNFIGTDRTGTLVVDGDLRRFGNDRTGVSVSTGNNRIGGSDADDGQADTIVRARNIISSNGFFSNNTGLSFNGATASANTILGNYIGVDVNGTGSNEPGSPSNFGNAGGGIFISDGSSNTIGDPGGGAGNVIAANAGHAITISNFTGSATGNVVQANLIGTARDGVTPIGNKFEGVRFDNGASGNRVGGDTAEAGNLIAHSTNGNGIGVGGTSARNTILSNRIFDNFALGIDLGLNGKTLNDVGDADTGANTLQNFPVLTTTTTTSAAGTLDSVAGKKYTIQFFASLACDASGNGEGKLFLGQLTGVDPNVTFTFPFPVPVPSGYVITATATDPDGNTSEFSSCSRNAAVTFVVTNTNDSGPGSLRQAIVDSNVLGQRDTIMFNIPGDGPHTIAPTSPLPTLTDSVVVDGYTQAGATANPNAFGLATSAVLKIELNGAGAGNTSGLVLSGGNSIVRGLAINRFLQSAISLQTLGGSTIEGNYLGTDVTGAVALGNVGGGIYVDSSNNTIGGPSVAARNVISGTSNGRGVSIGTNENPTNNTVQGNYIGTNAAGTGALGNSAAGVGIDTSGNHVIGNLISGGLGLGVNINGTTSTNNDVRGNYIGTDRTGTQALGNVVGGVNVNGPANTIGGTTVVDRNIISGNPSSGVSLTGATATGNRVIGNYIGTTASGDVALGNGTGVNVNAPANFIGGTQVGERNVISGNNTGGVGIFTSFSTTTPPTVVSSGAGTLVQGNYIGVDVSGQKALGNFSSGVSVGATGVYIGGTQPGAGNVISATKQTTLNCGSVSPCGGTGVGIFSPSSGPGGVTADGSGNFVQGNFIGTDRTGTLVFDGNGQRLGNASVGVSLNTGNNRIGGADADDSVPGTVLARNIISGNGFNLNNNSGVHVGASGNTILGNYIGTNVNGGGSNVPVSPSNFGNAGPGIVVFDASNTTIGEPAAGNVVAANGLGGIHISRSSTGTASGNLVQANLIGVAADGVTALGNIGDGVSIQNGASGNTVGGTTSAARNVISANQNGVSIVTGATGNEVKGNFIGTKADGLSALGNLANGVSIDGPGNTVGGSVGVTAGGPCTGACNVISGNNPGVRISGASATTNKVQGNHIGTNVNGTASIGNSFYGLYVAGLASNNTIGGSAPNEGNIISGNAGGGIFIDAGTSATTVQGNLVGTKADGLAALANASTGVTVHQSTGNVIGGTVGARNIISGNNGDGIRLQGTSSGNVVRGNRIGTNAAGSAAISNTGSGVAVVAGAGATVSSTTIGGSGAAGNVISGNAFSGIHLNCSNPCAGVITGAVIQGNIIGLDATGTVSLGNGATGDGIQLTNAGAQIGGTTADVRNVIGGNQSSGISLSNSGTSFSPVIQGNYIGTDISGSLDRGNQFGLSIGSAPGTQVGGSAAGAGNVISGNHTGVYVSGSTNNVVVQGNIIGLNAAGSGAIANTTGILLSPLAASTAGALVGGTVTGAGNTISGHSGKGVVVLTGTNHSILGNAIYSNGGLGIDLGDNGVTANDAGDADTGPNNLQNFPVLSTAVTTTGVTGTLSSTASTTFRLEFFQSDSADPSGNGEGQQLLGSIQVTTDGTGTASFTFPANLTVGKFVTATATDPAGSTSEFSNAIAVVAGSSLIGG